MEEKKEERRKEKEEAETTTETNRVRKKVSQEENRQAGRLASKSLKCKEVKMVLTACTKILLHPGVSY